MIFRRYHLLEGPKIEYLIVRDPQVIWSNIKEMYIHQKTGILPMTRYDWLHLRLHDFKFASEYNSSMFRIISQLIISEKKIINVEILEKNILPFTQTMLSFRHNNTKKKYLRNVLNLHLVSLCNVILFI